MNSVRNKNTTGRPSNNNPGSFAAVARPEAASEIVPPAVARARELAELEAQFAASGGRGVELAEKVDAARHLLAAAEADTITRDATAQLRAAQKQIHISTVAAIAHEILAEHPDAAYFAVEADGEAWGRWSAGGQLYNEDRDEYQDNYGYVDMWDKDLYDYIARLPGHDNPHWTEDADYNAIMTLDGHDSLWLDLRAAAHPSVLAD